MNKRSDKKLVVILLGSPGAGKGTQGQLLAEKLNLYYFDTSKILEEKFKKAKKGEIIKVKEKTYNLLNEKKLWKSGILCSPPFVAYLIKEKIKQLYKEDKNLLLPGSPRTLYEGKEIIPFLKKIYGARNIKVILIQVSAEESIWRNSHRRICRLMRHPILYNEKTKNLKKCPLDGSKLVRRKGLDDPETIKVRLKEYKKRTFPLIVYFKKEGLKVKKVNGSLPPAEVFKSILKVLK